MEVRKAISAAAVTGGISLAALGIGTGTATANAAAAPEGTAVGQTTQVVPALGAVKRPDLETFDYRGQSVTPVFDDRKQGWGFWFFGLWVPVVL
jgi:outer membrane lipoprotein SlyB